MTSLRRAAALLAAAAPLTLSTVGLTAGSAAAAPDAAAAAGGSGAFSDLYRTTEAGAVVLDRTTTDDGYRSTYLSFGRRSSGGAPVEPFVYFYESGYDRVTGTFSSDGTVTGESARFVLHGLDSGRLSMDVPVRVCADGVGCVEGTRRVEAVLTATSAVRADAESYAFSSGGFREAVTLTGVRRDAAASLSVDGRPVAGEQIAGLGRSAFLDHVLSRPPVSVPDAPVEESPVVDGSAAG